MPERHDAWLRVEREVVLKPLRLRAGGGAALGRRLGTVGVQGDQMPAAQVERIVAGCTRGGRRTEIVEVVGCGIVGRRAGYAVGILAGLVLVIAGDRVGDRIEPSPCRGVAGRPVGRDATGVLEVAEAEEGVNRGIGEHLVAHPPLGAVGGIARAAVVVRIVRPARQVADRRDHGISGHRIRGPRNRRPRHEQGRAHHQHKADAKPPPPAVPVHRSLPNLVSGR